MTNSTRKPKPPYRVDLGMHVVVEFELADGREELSFDLAPDEQADFARGFLGMGTPLAQAILGKTAGETVPYTVDDVRRVRILSVAPSNAAPPADVQARREETIRKAIDQSDRTNAMLFASSFSGKWGDYDPTGFELEEKDKNESEE